MRVSSMRFILALSAAQLLGAFTVPAARLRAQVESKEPAATLFKNVKVFDGKSERLSPSTSVLVVGNKADILQANPDHPATLPGLTGGRLIDLPLRDPLTMKPLTGLRRD